MVDARALRSGSDLAEQSRIGLDELYVEQGLAGIIGSGAFGEVRRGLHDGRAVALKSLHILRTDGDAMVEKGGHLREKDRAAILDGFLRECELLHWLRHENVLPVIGMAFDGEEPAYLVTPFVPSGALSGLVYDKAYAFLRTGLNGTLNLLAQARTLECIFSALVFLASREQPVLHRDVKPANILAVVEHAALSKVMLADFGEAKESVLYATNTQRPGFGTPVYMAPEMRLEDAEKSPKVDVFSAGVVAVEVNTGRPPRPSAEFRGAGRSTVFMVSELERRREDVSMIECPQVFEIVGRCIVDDPISRANASEVLTMSRVFVAEAELADALETMRGDLHSAIVVAERVSSLAGKEGGEAVLVAAGAMPALVAAMRAHPYSSDVQKSAAKAIQMTAGTDAGRAVAVDAGTVPALVAAMRGHPADTDVQECAAWATWRIAFSDSGKAAAVDADAVSALVASMRAHPGNTNVQTSAAAALRNITMSRAGRAATLGADGVPALLSAMRLHPHVPSVQVRAAGALQNIAGADSGREAIVATGSVPVIVAAMMNHPNAADVQKSTAGAIRNIAHSDQGREAVLQAGTLPALMAAMAAHPNATDTQLGAAMAIRSIAGSDRGRAAAVEAGAVAALVALMKAYPDAADVQKTAAGAIHNTVLSAAGNEAAVEAGAASALVAAMVAHPSVASVQESTACVLCSIAHSEQGREAAVQAGAVPALVATFASHPDDADILENSAGALWYLALSEAGKEAALDIGAVPALNAALLAHPDRAGLQSTGTKAIQQIDDSGCVLQ